MKGVTSCWLQVLGDLLCYPNRMAFDIMPGGGKAPEPKGLLVVKVKAVSNIKGGGDLFSKVNTPITRAALALLICPTAFSHHQHSRAQSPIMGCRGHSGQVHTGICAIAKHTGTLYGLSNTHFVPVRKGICSVMNGVAHCSDLRCAACARQLAADRALRPQVDPFVEMSVRDGRALHTKTIWNNKDPVFNEVLSFVVDDPEHQSITAMVKDDDMQAFAKVLSPTASQISAPH